MVNCTDAIFAVLAGTYTLLNTSATFNGKPVPDRAYGENPVGIITYSKSGYMSATITATEPEYRPENLRFPFSPNDTDSDWALVGKHGVAYAGPYSINTAYPANETTGAIFHGPLIVANVPSWVGDEQPRNYTIFKQPDGSTLLRIDSRRDGGNEGVLWWRKLD